MSIDLYKVPSERRHWVVRAEGGHYAPQFLTYGVIAVGHIDAALKVIPPFPPAKANWSTVHTAILQERQREGMRLGRIKSLVSQARTFTNEIAVGDWVLTPEAGVFRVGVVTGDAYWSDESLVISTRTGQSEMASHFLRRTVKWGPSIHKNEFSSPLRRSLSAIQTVFSVDEHWESIYHAIFPAFTRDDSLYLSARVNSTAALLNLDVASFLLVLSDMELIAREVESGLDEQNFDQRLDEARNNGELTLATKAEFYSPGDIWAQLVAGANAIGPGDSWMIKVVVAYGMLFGNSKLGFEGLIDVKLRHKIANLMIARIKKRRADKSVENMEMTLPNKDTKSIERNAATGPNKTKRP